MHWAGADDGGLSAWSSTSDIEVEVSSAQPSAPDLGPASPPPAYNASAGPRPLEMDRARMRADSPLAFAPTPTHYQIGIKRVPSSSSPDEPVMLTPTQQISTKSEGGTRIVFKPTISSHDAVKVPEEDALILGPRKPLQRLGRIILFMLCIVAVFGVFVIDAIVDRPEYCSLQPPPSAPPAAPAVGIVAAGKVCGEMAGARGAKFAWADSAAAGTPAGCIVFAAADGGGGGGGGGDATGDAASGEASGEASESVLFQPECTAPPAGCACGNCTTCDIEGCAVLRSLDELLGGAAGGDAPWACPEEHIYKEQAGVKRMLTFVIYSACAFVTAFLLLTRPVFSARWTVLACLPHDVQVTIATIVLGYLWPCVLPVLLHKTHAVRRFLHRHERAREYRARRAEARRERAEQRERRKAEARERRRQQQQEHNQCCWLCCDGCCAPPGPPYGPGLLRLGCCRPAHRPACRPARRPSRLPVRRPLRSSRAADRAADWAAEAASTATATGAPTAATHAAGGAPTSIAASSASASRSCGAATGSTRSSTSRSTSSSRRSACWPRRAQTCTSPTSAGSASRFAAPTAPTARVATAARASASVASVASVAAAGATGATAPACVEARGALAPSRGSPPRVTLGACRICFNQSINQSIII